MKIHALWLSASVVTLAWCGAAAAQTTSSSAAKDEKASAVVQELVVTAERRTTNLQTTPIAATVLSGASLDQKGVLTVDQLQFAMPGVTVNNFGQGNDFNIRGIGKAEHNSQTTTGVITYRDGVATFPGYFQGEPYFDIARVEVLRGPQGTFVGQNATGGAVFITSQDPIIGGEHHGYLAGQLGNYADAAAQGAVNLPVSDTFAARLAFDTERRDSFYKVTGPGSNNPDVGTGSVRLGLLWKPTEALSVLFKTDYNYLDFGGYQADPVLATNDPFHITANFPTKALDRFVRTSLKIDYVMANGITLRSVTGFQKGNTAYQADLDGTSAANFTFGDSVNETTWSEELNLISPSTGRVSYVLGVYLQTDKLDFLPGQFFIDTPTGSIFTEYRLEGTNPKQTGAVFGQLGFKLTDSLELQVGGRYSDARTTNHVAIVQFGTPIRDDQTVKFSNASGKVSLNWTIDPHNFVYGFVATGFRPGGLNVPVGLGIPAPFGSEKVTEYEIGWKAGFLDGHLRTQLNAYYNNYQNFQVTIGFPTFPTFGFELNTPNPTKIYGMEAQAEAVFGPLSFDAGLGLMHSEIGAFFATDPRIPNTGACNPASGPASPSCINLDGHEQTYAPEFTFNIGGQYVFDLAGGDTLTPRLNYGHVSKQWATLFENAARGDQVSARDIVSAQLTWTHKDLVATLYSTNLTDQHYMGALNSGLRFMGPPRQYGVRLMKTF
ncbi:TonB-dependent receptor [Phenylobacterium sp.]|uniref:TonB-dependent receptor n=1 Tax=Phenylobacterium sp. TaxID=1871053 RepID=UPI0035663942